MNEQARKIWNTQEGASLLEKMLSGEPLHPSDEQTLESLKQADPPKPTEPLPPTT